MKIVVDTSALISLAVAGLTEELIRITKIFVPLAVTEELREISSYEDEEGRAAQRLLELIKRGRIKEKEIGNKERVKSLLSPDIDRGEAECFVFCAKNQVGTLVIDDVSAAYALSSYAKTEDIELKVSAAAVSGLLKRGKISEERAPRSIKKISEIREWGGGVLEVLAKKYFPEL